MLTFTEAAGPRLGDADPLAVPARPRAVRRAAGDRPARRADARAHRPGVPDRLLRPGVAAGDAGGRARLGRRRAAGAAAGADRPVARLRGAHRLRRGRVRRRDHRPADGPELRRLLQPDERRRGDRREPLLRHLGVVAVHRHRRPPAADRRGGAELHARFRSATSRSPSCAASSRSAGAPRSSASACGSRCRWWRCCSSPTSCSASSRASRSR